MNNNLSVCHDCQRHVRDDELACPFCASSLAPTHGGSIEPPEHSRAPRVAAAVAVALTLGISACVTVSPPYGVPALDVPQADTQSDAQAQDAAPND